MKYFVSIITVNYNGKRLLGDFLKSCFDQDYPQDLYEVVVVDNGSSDDSIEYVRNNFPRTKIVKSKVNLGFGKGNNLGMRKSKGNLYFLLNNDTFLDRNAVRLAVEYFTKNKNKKIAAVNAKLVFIDKYLPITMEEVFYSEHKIPFNADPINKETFVLPHESSAKFIDKVLIPFRHDYSDALKIDFILKLYRRNEFCLYLGSKKIPLKNKTKIGEDIKVTINLTKGDLNKYKKDLIQNAGNFYFRDGAGRDRGAVIYTNRQYYEVDEGQYNNIEEIEAFCGAGVLLNKKALESVGYFDRNFFMYYEDADISFRFREAGWKVIYNPNILVRHIHSASSKEWSPLFTFNAERGRLIFVSKHWPVYFALRQLLRYLFRDTFAIFLYRLIKLKDKNSYIQFTLRLKVLWSVVAIFILNLFRKRRMSYNQYLKLA